jgi:putative GTP pyrophosphokinase
VALPSKSEINRCGDLLRDHLSGTIGDWGKHYYALDVLGEFRSSFQYPLAKVTTGLRAMVKAETGNIPVVAQRLKRMDRILLKLERMPKTNVVRLEDIGGCRAVLASPAEVNGVLRRIRRRWDVVRERDYRTVPRSSGYRAYHAVVDRDGRRIEVQLRTRNQQYWADSVESFASALNLPLKDESGPDEVLEYFRVAGDGIYREDYGVPVDEEFLDRFRAAEQGMQDWARKHYRR